MLRNAARLFWLLPALLAVPALAQDAPLTLPLWPPGHPTLKNQDAEEVVAYRNNDPAQGVNSYRNVHTPLIVVQRPPADKANGAAMVIAPGGGHNQLVWGGEGTVIADWLNELGVTAVILKYRLASYNRQRQYNVAEEPVLDTMRAIRMTRMHAKEWGVDPDRIGFIGFSAGGYLGAEASLRYDAGNPDAADPIDRVSSRPDYVCLVYPGWGRLDVTMVPPNCPPAFLTSAGVDDRSHAVQTVEYYDALFQAQIPVELHIYGHGGHGGNIQPRDGIPFGAWHTRFQEWLTDIGAFKPGPIDRERLLQGVRRRRPAP